MNLVRILYPLLVLASSMVGLTNLAVGQYETSASNINDGTLWGSTTSWDNPFGTGSANAPGSNAGGAATDTVVLSHHEGGGGTQTYFVGSDVGTIAGLEINGGTATGNGGNGDHVQLQIRDGANLNVTGVTVLGENQEASISLNQTGASTLALRGDINLAASPSAGGLNSFIEHTSNSATLVIGGDINGQAIVSPSNIGGISLLINSTADVIYNTTGGLTTDTNTQTLNVEEFGVGLSDVNNDFGVHTLSEGKVVNTEDLRVGNNTSTAGTDRAVSGTLTVENTTITTTDDGFVGRVNSSSSLGTQVRTGTGILNVDIGATVNIGDELLIGSGAGATAAANQNAVGTLNINGGLVAVNNDVVLGESDNASGTVNVNSGSLTTSTGELHIGGNASGTNADAGAVGEFTVGAVGIVTIGDGAGEQNVFIGRDGMGTLTSAGTFTVTNGDVFLGDSSVATGQTNSLNVTEGTFTVASGQLIAGSTAGNTGVIDVSNGNLIVSEEIYLGGNVTTGTDDGASGSLAIGLGGTVTVNDGVNSTNQNLEVGRDGTGVLSVDGGTLNLHTGDLVVGQDAAASQPNNSRGTVTFSDGAQVNIGDTFVDGADTDGRLNDFNINEGGGDITQSGPGTLVRIERDLNFQDASSTVGEEATNPNSSYTISEGTLEIGDSLVGRTSAGMNTFTVVGDTSTISIGTLNANGDLDIDESSFTLAFDFQDGNTISAISVADDVRLDGLANLSLLNTFGLTNYTNDILLIDLEGSSEGVFAGLAEGAAIAGTEYRITYQFSGTNGSNDIGLVQAAVPEPSSFALLGVVGAVFMRRARKRKLNASASESIA